MTLNGVGRVTWIMEDDEGEKGREEIDLGEYVMRSLADTLIEKGEDAETVKKVAEKHGIEVDDYPYHPVIFNSLRRGGKRRLTRRRRSRKQ